MKSMKKVEIVFEGVYINRVLKIFEKHKILGYTLIKDVEGRGGHGFRSNDDVTDICTNDYIFTVCEEQQFTKMESDIRMFLERYGGKCMLSDVMLLLGEKQRAEHLNLQYSGNRSES